jgi:hypothetical membrane protein
MRERYPPIGFLLGLFAVIYFWVAVSIDAYLNSSWWRFTGSSFSALGDPSPNATGAAAGLYWIYNDVVIFPTAGLILLFSAALILVARNKIQATGGSFLMVSGIFLALVGIYHGGPPTPGSVHDFVSTWFFIQAAFGIFIWGIGTLWQGERAIGWSNVALVIGAIVIGFSVKFGSVAETEAFAIVVIDIWVIWLYFLRKSFFRP